MKDYISPRFHIREGVPQENLLREQLKNLGFQPLTAFQEIETAIIHTCPKQEGLEFLSSLPDRELGFTYRVSCGRRVLGIPRSSDQAHQILKLLSGRRHQVWIGFGGTIEGKFQGKMIESRISFKRLTPQEMTDTIEKMSNSKVSGGYDGGGFGARFIKTLNGSPAVLGGLPAYEFLSFLQNWTLRASE